MWKRGGARSERRKKSRSGGDARETVGAFNDSKLDHNVAGWGGRGGGENDHGISGSDMLEVCFFPTPALVCFSFIATCPQDP